MNINIYECESSVEGIMGAQTSSNHLNDFVRSNSNHLRIWSSRISQGSRECQPRILLNL